MDPMCPKGFIKTGCECCKLLGKEDICNHCDGSIIVKLQNWVNYCKKITIEKPIPGSKDEGYYSAVLVVDEILNKNKCKEKKNVK